MKQLMTFLIFIMMIISFTTSAFAGWLIYHKPEFRGQVIDAETKEPIEGAVVVVVYKKHSLISGPGGGYTSVIKVKEALTDKKGEFKFPPYTTLIQPNSIEDNVEFIIYKPGYGSYPNMQKSPLHEYDAEYFFLLGNFGKKEERRTQVNTVIEDKIVKTITEVDAFTFGVVELPKLITRDERLRAMPATPVDYRSKELPLLYKTMNEENKRFGLGELK